MKSQRALWANRKPRTELSLIGGRASVGLCVLLMLWNAGELQADGLAETIQQLNQRHPRVQERALQLAASLDEASYRGSVYPDPMLGISFRNLPYKRNLPIILDQEPMTGIEYMLTQPIPFPGRLSAEAEIADLGARASRLRLALEKNTVTREFLLALIEFRNASESLALAENYGDQSRVVADTARARYSVGRGNLAGVTRANLDQDRYNERIERLQGLRDSWQRRLEYYFPENETPPTDSLLALSREVDGYLAELWREMQAAELNVATESLLVALGRVETERTGRDESLARYDYLPDFQVFASYMRRDRLRGDRTTGEDFYSFGLTMRVPLWSALSNSDQVESRTHLRRAEEVGVADMTSREQSEFAAARERFQTASERVRLFRESLIPRARLTRDSLRTTYETGESEIFDLLQVWNELYMLESECLAIELERNEALITMLAIVNRILPAGEGHEP